MAVASVVVDTGPIVALLDADDRYHDWAKAEFGRLRPPLITCEAVLTEVGFLVARFGGDVDTVAGLVDAGLLTVKILFDGESPTIGRLLRRYKNVPMSFTDACLVRLVELTPNATLFTLDSDFTIYRQKGRSLIPLVSPR